MPARPVLVVQHEDAAPPGHLSGWARRSGALLDVRRCHAGDPLPAALSEHSGLVVLGGDMGAYDDARYPWLTSVKSLVIQSVIQSVPFLGICLGHQLAAVALGGRVSPNPDGPRRGVYPVELLPEAADDALISALPPGTPLTHWNGDIVGTVPGGATVLARDPQGEAQIVRYAEQAWGIQGHPEADTEIVDGWGQGEALSGSPHDQGTDDILRRMTAAREELETGWGLVGDRFFEATLRPEAGRGRAVVPLPPAPSTPHLGRVHHR